MILSCCNRASEEGWYACTTVGNKYKNRINIAKNYQIADPLVKVAVWLEVWKNELDNCCLNARIDRVLAGKAMQQYIEFALSHWLLITALVGVLILLVIEEVSALTSSKYEIDPDQAAILIQKGAIIYDIRDRSLYKKSHIKGAKWIKYNQVADKPESILNTDNDMIFYCDNGTRSGELTEMLRKKQGYKIHFISGGLKNWSEGGFSVQEE